MAIDPNDPHAGRPVLAAGAPLESAPAAMILLHGRGADARDILGVASALQRPDIAYLAPDAAGNAWYRNRFMSPDVRSEPALPSALNVVARLLEHLDANGIPAERTVILGFSQGGCLATEYAARNPRRYGGVVGLSAGLIGERISPDEYSGSLAGTPVFLGCSDVDGHIPLQRVQETTAVFRQLGADVTERIYPGMAHTIVEDEVEHVRKILDKIAPGGG